jgi:hypothetical protein
MVEPPDLAILPVAERTILLVGPIKGKVQTGQAFTLPVKVSSGPAVAADGANRRYNVGREAFSFGCRAYWGGRRSRPSHAKYFSFL